MPTITVQVDQLDHSASQGSVREHQLTMDRPEAKGGQNKGPMGGEALLMSLGGCFMSNLLAAAKARVSKRRSAREARVSCSCRVFSGCVTRIGFSCGSRGSERRRRF